MNQAVARRFIFVLLVVACTSWAQAQDESSQPKQTRSKAAQDAKAKAAWEKKAKERAKADADARAKAVDINHASKEELKALGLKDAYVDAIVAKRPYKVKADLVAKNAIPFGLYQSIRKKVAAK